MKKTRMKIGFTPKGSYDNTVTYDVLDVVSYGNGTYVSIISGNTNNLPTASNSWAMLVDPTDVNKAVENANKATQSVNAVIDTVNTAVDTVNTSVAKVDAALATIDDTINKKVDTKFGFQRAVADTQNGTYTIQSFGSSELADAYDQDPTGNIGNLLNSYQILMGSGSGGGGGGSTIYKVRCVNNLPSLYFSATKNDPCYINFTFTSLDTDGNDTNENGTCHIFLKNGNYSTYTEVKTINVVSNVPVNYDVSSLLADGYNYIMLKIVGEVSEAMTPALVYTINLTSLSLDISSFDWWTAKTSNFILPCIIGGNVKKSLHVIITGTNYSKEYTIDLGTTTYIDTAYNYTVENPTTAGIYNLQAYVINSDGSVKTNISSFNFMSRVAGDQSKLMVVNSLITKLINWSDNTVLLYSVCNGENQTSVVDFFINKGVDTIYSTNDTVQTNKALKFLYTMELETKDNSNFNVTLNATDGTSTLLADTIIPVDNALSFSASSGYIFYVNPKNRSNSQSNYTKVVNEYDNSEIDVDWTNLNWITDGWTVNDDNRKVLRILNTEKAVIKTKLLQNESVSTGKTIEVKAKITNVSDYTLPWFTLGYTNTQGNFCGIKIFPNKSLLYTELKHDDTTQSYPLNDDVDINITFSVVPNTYGNVGYNTIYMYVDGKKCRAFNYESTDSLVNTGYIELGSTGCDVDIYAIRAYDIGLSASNVFNNYVNLLSTRDEKTLVKDSNDVFNTEDTEIDFNKISKVKRTFTFSNTLPNKANPGSTKGTLRVIYPEDSTKNVTITNVTAAGQGSTSKGYYEWNIRFTINSNSVITNSVGAVVSGTKWQMYSTIPACSKFTAKLNWASMSQDHKCGSVNCYTDLFKNLGLTNPAIQKDSKVRVSVFEEPFVGFTELVNSDNETVYTFTGEYTLGPDKGDKYCFGYSTSDFPNLISIEGSDNAPLPALYRVPWNTNRITYQVIDSKGIDGWVYNDASAFDFDSGNTANISQFIPAYNLVHSCSNLIKEFNGTLDELNAQITTYRSTQYMYWIAKTGDTNYGNLYYYEASETKYIGDDIGDGTINLFTQLVDKGYGLTTADTTGKTASELTALFIAARIQKAYLEWGTLWDIDDALFHDCWVELTAGTDQRAKNTYPYIFGTDTDKKVRWRTDDMDTIWPTNNQGLLTKSYSTEVGDKYTDGGPQWNGETSVFHNVLALAFKKEMSAMMSKMIMAMEELSGATTGTDYDKLIKWYEKYYIGVKKYFPEKVINEFAKHFEKAELKYKSGEYQSDTEPITQIVGDAMSPDMSFVKKRLVYIMSKYSLGLFNSKSSGAITVRTAGNDITYKLTPAIDMYPNIANGESVIRGPRTFANNVCTMTIDLGGSADQQNTILGSDYLTDIGDWHDKNVFGAMSVTGKRLKNLILGSTSESVTITITSLTLGNCYSLKKLMLANISTLQGGLDLTNCNSITDVDASGTNLTSISMPDGGLLSKISYPSTIQQVTLKNFPLLTTQNTTFASYSNITLLNLENLGGLDIYSIAKKANTAKTLKSVRLVNMNGTDEELTDLYNISQLKGVDASGNIVSKPTLTGKFYAQYAEKGAYTYLTNNFPDLKITYGQLYDKSTVTVKVTDENSNALSGATVVIGDTTLTTDSTGLCATQTIGKQTITVTKDGYDSATMNITVGRTDITLTIQIYKLYSIIFTCSTNFGLRIKGVSITVGSETIVTGSDGVATFSRTKATYSYVAKYGTEADKTGSATISTSNANVALTFNGNIADYKPSENGNIQLGIKGSSYSITITNGNGSTVHWGDGSTSLVSVDTATTMSHTYSANAFYQVEISECSAITLVSVSNLVLAFWSIGNSKISGLTFGNMSTIKYVGDVFINDTARTSFLGCFNGCNNLSYISSTMFQTCINVTNFGSCFANCTSLISIPSGLFNNCTKVTSFVYCFSYCSKLTSIPTGLFNDCTQVTSFDSCFDNCTSLISISSGLFDNCTQVTSFVTCFNGCTSLTSIPTGLFDNCVNVSNFFRCFYTCMRLTSIPTGLFDNCTKVTNFDCCFYSCTSLTSIPAGLFDNCTEVKYFGGSTGTTFYGCFAYCTKLTSIPSGLFDNCTKVTSFDYCFCYCGSLTSVPSLLFSNKKSNPTTFYGCFYYCGSLKEIGSGLFSGCTYGQFSSNYYGLFEGCAQLTSIPYDTFLGCSGNTSFSICFKSCSSLTSIPAGLFDSCVSVTNFYGCFYGCTSLKEIPSGLFDNCVNVKIFGYTVINNTLYTNYSGCFCYCTSLTSIPAGLFNNCTKIIGIGACFSSCSSLTSIPSGLFDNCNKIICFYTCFSSCSSLTSIPSGLFDKCTEVKRNDYMFRGCKLLKYINLPISFTLYNEYMLGDCNNLDYIQCPVSIPPSLTISAFSNTNNCPIYVPVESINTYKTASGWSTYADRITRPNLTADVTLTVHFKTSDDTEVSTKTYTILSGTPSYYEISSNDLIDGYKNDTALIDLSTGTSVEYTVATYSIVTYTVTKHFTDGSGNTVKIDETESFSVGNGKYNEVTVSTTTTEIIYNSETINITNNYQKITLTANTDITFVYKKQLITWSGNWTQNNISTYGANSYKSDAVADSGSSVERITVTGVTTLVLSCRSYGESGYDYLTVGNIDTSCTRSTYLYSLINKSSATTWYDYTYTFSDIGTHYIEVCYSKDSGGIAGDDAAYVYVKSYS